MRDRGEPALAIGDDHPWIARVDTRRVAAPAPNEHLSGAHVVCGRGYLAIRNVGRCLRHAEEKHDLAVVARHTRIERANHGKVRSRGSDAGRGNDRILRGPLHSRKLRTSLAHLGSHCGCGLSENSSD